MVVKLTNIAFTERPTNTIFFELGNDFKIGKLVQSQMNNPGKFFFIYFILKSERTFTK
jgi:hypothetical protein